MENQFFLSHPTFGKNYIYVKPRNTYQHFINAFAMYFRQCNGAFVEKKRITDEGVLAWKSLNKRNKEEVEAKIQFYISYRSSRFQILSDQKQQSEQQLEVNEFKKQEDQEKKEKREREEQEERKEQQSQQQEEQQQNHQSSAPSSLNLLDVNKDPEKTLTQSEEETNSKIQSLPKNALKQIQNHKEIEKLVKEIQSMKHILAENQDKELALQLTKDISEFEEKIKILEAYNQKLKRGAASSERFRKRKMEEWIEKGIVRKIPRISLDTFIHELSQQIAKNENINSN